MHYFLNINKNGKVKFLVVIFSDVAAYFDSSRTYYYIKYMQSYSFIPTKHALARAAALICLLNAGVPRAQEIQTNFEYDAGGNPTKPRGGIAGGGPAGRTTSIFSGLNHAAAKRGTYTIATRNALTKVARKIPYVGWAMTGYEVYDAFSCD